MTVNPEIRYVDIHIKHFSQINRTNTCFSALILFPFLFKTLELYIEIYVKTCL